MDFSFTDEQATLRQSVAGYLQKSYDVATRRELVASERPFSTEVWRTLRDLGLLALPFPEELGGYGGSVVDLVAVAEPFGEALLVEPYLPSVVLAGRALAATAEQPSARDWLTRLMTGEALGAFAHEEGPATADPTRVALQAERVGDRLRLSGDKRLVLGAAEADVLVVTARLTGEPGSPDGLALLLVEPGAGVRLTPVTTVDGRSAAHVSFDGVEVAADQLLADDAYAVVADVVGLAILVLAAEAVGAMGALLRQTSEYASVREQFGVPIGTFQAVAHRLADMKIAHTQARATLLYTTALAEAGRAAAYDLSVLKAQVGRLGRRVGEAAIQTHGGVGMTDELAVGHYVKRLLAIDAMLGDSEHHLRRVGAGA